MARSAQRRSRVDGIGASVLWLGRVALEGVRLAARGSIVPHLEVASHSNGRSVDARVRWVPALADAATIDAFAAAMPATVAALTTIEAERRPSPSSVRSSRRS